MQQVSGKHAQHPSERSNNEKLPNAAKVIGRSREKRSERQRRMRALETKKRAITARVKHEQVDRLAIATAMILVSCPIFSTSLCASCVFYSSLCVTTSLWLVFSSCVRGPFITRFKD